MATNSLGKSEEYEAVFESFDDIQAKPATPQSILRAAIRILDSNRPASKESALWRINDAIKLLQRDNAKAK